MLNGYKSKLQSMGIWGSGLVIVSAGVQAVATYFGFTVGEADMSQAVVQITNITAGISGLLALIGRIRATKKVW